MQVFGNKNTNINIKQIFVWKSKIALIERNKSGLNRAVGCLSFLYCILLHKIKCTHIVYK